LTSLGKLKYVEISYWIEAYIMLIRRGSEPMLTVREVANLLHVHVNTVRRWSNRGILKSYQINVRGDRRFRQVDVALFLTKMNSNANAQDGAEK
jgi:excisionase family DNA binding protein